MKKLPFRTLLAIFAFSLLLTSCKKSEDETTPANPTITLTSATGYISSNNSAAYGDTLKFGVTLGYNSTDMLVKFRVTRNSGVLIDSTINTTWFTMDILSTKNTEANEIWIFEVTDLAGHSNSSSITITGAFGAINNYSSIVLGAQNNTLEPSFVSYSGATFARYFQAEAFNHQADIDMFCFYENTPSNPNYMTLAAPGSNITGIFTGPTAPSNYTTKNITYFVKTSLTTSNFDAVSNDAVILASFNPSNKFKKAKVLTVGDVYAFLLQSGKYGLLKVTNVTGVEDGTLTFAVKIQQ